MAEFLGSYGIWIFLGVLFPLMFRGRGLMEWGVARVAIEDTLWRIKRQKQVSEILILAALPVDATDLEVEFAAPILGYDPASGG